MEFVGKIVKKEFKGSGLFSGIVQSYDASSGFFEIVYEDGGSEELDLSEVVSLLKGKEGEPVDYKPRFGRKPKKRRRVELGQRGNRWRGADSSNSNTQSAVWANGNLNRNRNFDLNCVAVGDLRENECANGNLGNKIVDFNETVEKGSGVVENFEGSGYGSLSGNVDLKQVFDLNSGFNVNLNEGFDLNEDNVNVNFQRNVKKGECIDLNLDLNGDMGGNLKDVHLGDNVVGTQKRQCAFDLNLGIEEEVKDDIDGDFGRQGKKNSSIETVKEETQNMEVGDIGVKITRSEGAIANGTLEDVHVSDEAGVGSVEGMWKEDIVSGEDLGPSDSVEVLDVEVKQDYPEVIHGNHGDIGSACKEGSRIQGRGRRSRRRKNLVNNLDFTLEPTVLMDANGVKEDCSVLIDGNQGVMGSAYKEVSGSSRKRRKLLDNGNSAPETTVLRRSARRVSVKSNVSTTTTSNMTDDLSVSPAVTALTEEKHVRSPGEWPEVPVLLPPKVQLPPSSCNLDLGGIPILDLFSIYTCLRSFSTLLFLSPFELEEFVAALKCTSPSSLFDCIHVSILQILRKHLEHLSNEGSESASNCLGSLNWGLLDTITWPIFMVEYLLIHESGLIWGFDISHLKVFKSDYYKQPVSVKLEILRCLCDSMIEVEAIRSELNSRSSGAESELDFDRNVNMGAYKKRRAAMDVSGNSCLTMEPADDTTDGNSDECCLCKMDGSLICCDGCPAAYHSKCVGIANDSLPEGDWFCPECAIDRHKPWMKLQKSLRGADLLGVDPYGRLYFSSCDYLLVSDSCDTETLFNYYHSDDLSIVIEALKSSKISYSSILEAIRKHWDIPVTLYIANSNSDSLNHTICSDTCMLPASLASLGTCAVNESKPEKNFVNGYSGHVDVKSVIPTCMSSEASAETVQMNSGNQNFQKEGPDCSNRFTDFLNESEIPVQFPPIGNNSLTSKRLDIRLENKIESAASGHASSAVRTSKRETLQVQPVTGYMNYYSFGHTAASVVEELMSKSLDKNTVNIKSVEEIISSQMKAISKKSNTFLWSNILGLNADLWKEKCGWCFPCRFPTDDFDCLFNMTWGPVREGSVCEVASLQSKRNWKGHLIDIICHLLLIEDRLQGLLLGPWLNPHYSKLWRKSILKASDIVSVKCLLLTLESNLHHLALSAEWLKHMDFAVTMGSASHIVTASRGSSKSGFGRKRARHSEFEPNPSSNSASGLIMFWWRGGRLSRQLFGWKVLPHSLVSKAARQAGCTRIPGVLYSENSEFSKRNKNVSWRAAVELSTTVEQLALQVRELDSNIRWDEIENTHPLTMLDKEYRKSTRLFKKVIIRRKCADRKGSKYLLDFGKRKVIPEVVLKNGSVVEESSSERKKYWLNESYVPLYLLKSFEEKRIARKCSKISPGKLSEADVVVKKPSRKNGFSNLFAKAERSEYLQCGHCNKDVLISEAVCCQHCKGFFHKRHIRKSAGSIIAECVYTCHRCQDGKHVNIDKKIGKRGAKRGKNNSKRLKVQQPKSVKASLGCKSVQLKNTKKTFSGSWQLRSQKNKKVTVVMPLRRSARKAKYNSLENKKVGGHKNRKQARSVKGTYKKPKKDISWRKLRTHAYHSYWLNGLLLSRKPEDERAMHFRRKRFLAPVECVIRDEPKCHLCCGGYTSRSNYISCELCGEWFHGEAFGLNAENISKLIGFRCHVCRKGNPPVCPCVPAMGSLGSQIAEAQNNIGLESLEYVTNTISHPSERNLLQDLVSNQDDLGSLPVDESFHREEQEGFVLD